MSLDEPRTVPGEVDIGGDDSPTVSPHDLHGDSGAPFEAPTYVAAVPCQSERNLGIDS